MNEGIKMANIRERMRILRVTLAKWKKMKLQHSHLDETSARELIPRKSQYRNHKPCKTASFKEDLFLIKRTIRITKSLHICQPKTKLSEN